MLGRQSYSTALKLYTKTSGDVSVARAMGTARSTAYSWIQTSFEDLVGNDSDFHGDLDLELFHAFHKDKTKKEVVRAVNKVVDFYRTLIDPIKKTKKMLSENKTKTLELIQGLSETVGLSNTPTQPLKRSTKPKNTSTSTTQRFEITST